jgi:hypothetical protein
LSIESVPYSNNTVLNLTQIVQISSDDLKFITTMRANKPITEQSRAEQLVTSLRPLATFANWKGSEQLVTSLHTPCGTSPREVVRGWIWLVIYHARPSIEPSVIEIKRSEVLDCFYLSWFHDLWIIYFSSQLECFTISLIYSVFFNILQKIYYILFK